MKTRVRVRDAIGWNKPTAAQKPGNITAGQRPAAQADREASNTAIGQVF